MELDYSIIANKPVDATVGWVRAGKEVCVTIDGSPDEIAAALRDLFSDVLEMTGGDKIAKRALWEIGQLISELQEKGRVGE